MASNNRVYCVQHIQHRMWLVLYVSLCLLVQCPSLQNGALHCLNGATGAFGDTCSFSCNAGYQLQGPEYGACLANQIWSSGLPSCVPHNCSNRIYISNNEYVNLDVCSVTYLSQCVLFCKHGFTGDNITYLCNVTSNPTLLDWVPFGGVHVQCTRGLLLL